MASKSNLHAFLAGSALTASLFYIYQRAQTISRAPKDTPPTKRVTKDSDVPQTNNRSDNCSQLMDSASLDQRMIRKAEGAIRNRTSRLIIVVERCTNDHNYVSCLSSWY
jgi:hypothetical protein